MYRFPSIDILVTERSTNGHPSMSFRSHQNSDHLPSIAILPTSSDEYRLPSISIHDQLQAKHASFQKAPD